MAREMLYYTLDSFNDYFQECKAKGEDFELTKTTYTRKLKKDDYTIIFNEEGKKDFLTLCLINKVRKDARKFISLSQNSYINFFNMVEMPNPTKLIHKIDIRSAYWNYAIKVGLITEETNKFFEEKWFGYPTKYAKKIRLKALGSLATTKISVNYVNGKRIKDTEEINTQETKSVYMEICRGIDEMMQECVREVQGCIYYYWDCIFIENEFSQDAIDFFKNKDFDVTVGETKLEYHVVNGTGYLRSEADGNMYMTRAEYKNNLPDLDEDLWN